MTNRLVELRALELSLERMTARLDQLRPEVDEQVSFLEDVRAKGLELGLSDKDIAAYFDPKPLSEGEKKTRKARSVKVYVNPNTSEEVHTKGGNHATLKAWKEKYGKEEVESWLQA